MAPDRGQRPGPSFPERRPEDSAAGTTPSISQPDVIKQRPGKPPPQDWRAQWQAGATEASGLCRKRRELVLGHPDLAQRLTEWPLEYVRPDQWNGFVPPRIYNGELNGSPRRAALAAICEEAQSRETEYIRALDVT